MGLKRIFSRMKRNFCMTSEKDVVSFDHEGSSVPFEGMGMNTKRKSSPRELNTKRKTPTRGSPVDLDEVFDEMYNEPRLLGSEYESSYHHTQQEQPLIVGDTGRYDLSQIGEEHDDGILRTSSSSPSSTTNPLLNLRFVKSKFFQTERFNSGVQIEDTVLFGPEEAFDGVFEDEEKSESSLPSPNKQRSSNNNNLSTPPTIKEDFPISTKTKPQGHNEVNPVFKKPFTSTKVEATPPVAEITRHRRGRSDMSAVSDISSLSGTKDNPLEFSLQTGFKQESAYMISLTEDIMRSLERKAARQQAQHAGNNDGAKSSVPGCLLLVTDPRKRIFEIVQIPYHPERSAVSDLLGEVSKRATDHRLKRQTYTGLSYNGMHFASQNVPVVTIVDSIAKRQPLLAIPKHFSVRQMELIGKNLLESPQVKILLEEQLVALGIASNVAPATDNMVLGPEHQEQQMEA